MMNLSMGRHMGYDFSEGPRSTSKSRGAIADVIEEVGQDRRFMGPGRKFGVWFKTTLGSWTYEPFAPSPNDDPFTNASNPKPAASVGWRLGAVDTNLAGMKMTHGWRVIFHIYDDGSSRRVEAKVQGRSERREVKRFVSEVFDLL